MPREITDREALVNAVKNLELISELFDEQNGKLKYASDLEVILNGRDYGNGKRVGPYVRLLEYEPEIAQLTKVEIRSWPAWRAAFPLQ